jgi:hypothetical protein
MKIDASFSTWTILPSLVISRIIDTFFLFFGTTAARLLVITLTLVNKVSRSDSRDLMHTFVLLSRQFLHALEAFFLTVLVVFFCESTIVVCCAQRSVTKFIAAEYFKIIIEMAGTGRMVVPLMLWSAFDWP